MAIKNRPIPPTRILPGTQWPGAQSPYDWLANTFLPGKQTNHGLELGFSFVNGVNMVLDLHATGALTWLIVAAKNAHASSTLEFGVTMTIDGLEVLDRRWQVLAQNDNAVTVVGHIGFGFGASAPIRAAASDYVVFDKNLIIELYQGASDVDVVAGWKVQVT